MKNKKLLGNGLLLLTAMIWGTAFVFQRSGMEIIEPLTFNAARMTLAAVVIGALALVMRRKRRETSEAEQKKVDKNTVRAGSSAEYFWRSQASFSRRGWFIRRRAKQGLSPRCICGLFLS